MSWLKRLLNKPEVTVTGAWTDVDATTAGPMEIRKPINIRRTMFPAARRLGVGDQFNVKLTTTDERGAVHEDRCPTFHIERTIVVDSITKFEVIDELGVDVGIGFVLGQAKR